MTKTEAVKECKKLWEDILMSGLSKDEFFESDVGAGWSAKNFYLNCPLCEYVKKRTSRCTLDCPLVLQYRKGCNDCGFETDTVPTAKWLDYVFGLNED